VHAKITTLTVISIYYLNCSKVPLRRV